MTEAANRGAFVRMFSSALVSQVVLSAASFWVGLLLIRRTSDLQYGYYILVSGGILLACSLQNAFIAPAMVHRMTRMSRLQCGDLTGGLYREQRRVIAIATGIALALTLLLWVTHLITPAVVLLMLTAIVATVTALRREFFRMVLLAYRRAYEVLRGDCLYALLLGCGVLAATFTSMPAAVAIVAAGTAALLAGAWLSRGLRRQESWNLQGEPGVLRQIAPLGAWSTAGAAIHWSFSQGYTVMIAATLDVTAIAAVAATRLLVMPVNLLSSGIGSLMLPLAARWLHDSGASVVLQRLLGFALGIASLSLVYIAVLWLMRDWIFDVILDKQFAQRDLLLVLWSASFVLMAINQQLLWLLIARARFRPLTALGLGSAVVALACSYWSMAHVGGAGAPMGILLGELIHTIGIVVLSLRETHLSEPQPQLQP